VDTFIRNNKHNQVTSTYYLILKKIERDTGRNYVFEQVQIDKKRNAVSEASLNTMKMMSSPQTKISIPSKIMMNQTMVGGFQRAGPQASSKSEGKPIRHYETQLAGNNPATQKYLE
jgi:hypothetical protein